MLFGFWEIELFHEIMETALDQTLISNLLLKVLYNLQQVSYF